MLALALVACEVAIVGPGGTVPLPELRNAPLSTSLAGRTLVLDTYLWRDFQPSSPPDGKPMIAVLRLRTTSGDPVPSGIAVDAAWVVMGDDAWVSQPVQEQPRSASAPAYEVVSRNGPKWGPGVLVDVIVQVRDGEGNSRLLRAADQPIHRTD